MGRREQAGLLALFIAALRLPAIPEAGTWAVLVAGFGVVGASLRRRRLVAA